MSTITVSLDLGTGTVTCNPGNLPVNRGNETITWNHGGSQGFTFASLSGLPSPPFSAPNVSDDEITVTDDNQNNGPEVNYPYTVCVQFNGQTYCSGANNPKAGSGDPTIKNK